MVIDWIYVILLAYFLYRGYKKGFIVALLSIVAVIVGIAAALKLSGTIGNWLFANHPTLAKWAPFMVYVLVFIIAVWGVHLLAKMLQKTAEAIAMGWLNKFLGALVYGIVISLVYSVFLYLFTNMGIIEKGTMSQSRTYSVIEPLAPRVIDLIGVLIPVLKDSFSELSRFFDKVNGQISGYMGG